jgi:hypothetical protein
MGKVLQRTHHLSRLRKFRPTLRASLDVRYKRRHAEAGLAVEQLIDFVGK